jgi:hypothetical protein
MKLSIHQHTALFRMIAVSGFECVFGWAAQSCRLGVNPDFIVGGELESF